MKQKTKKEYILDFFKKNPNKIFSLSQIDVAVKRAFEKDQGNSQIYVNRTPRDLVKLGFIPSINGYIERPKRGHFRFVIGKKLILKKNPFSESIKIKIKERDSHQCQMCGLPETENEVLAIDHVIPEDSGGKGTLENGITLCNKCNNIKKNLNVTTFGKKLFEKYLTICKKSGLHETVDFLEEILDIYKKYKKN